MVMDLSARIRAINKMNGHETPAPQPIEPPVEPEPVTQEEAEMTWADAQREEPEVTLADLKKSIDELKEVIAAQADDLKKINKHVNATQKLLKKGK